MSAAAFVSPEKSQIYVRTPARNGELIRKNMQEVLDSVQKIHKQRQKHRKKKRNDKDSPTTSRDSQQQQSQNQNQNQKSPLKEITKNKTKNPEGNELIVKTTPTKQNSILNHFAIATRKSENSETPGEEGKPRKSNAFEIMMSARNKSIGGGTPGKSPSAEEVEENPEKTKSAKRKLMLQEWNEKKGGRKRKLDEDKRDDYITQQMDARAKRLKKMLSSESPKPEILTPEPSEPTRKSSQRKRTKRLASMEPEVEEPKAPTEDNDFQSKLNSPIKKRDSLLGYFPKVQSPNEVQSTPETPVTPAQKRKGRRKRGASETPVASEPIVESKEEVVEVEEVQTRRPRRSCTVQSSKPEPEEPPSPPKAPKGRKTKNDSSVIEVDEGSDYEDFTPHKSTPNAKIAPLFMKSVPKPVLDPEVVKARQEFLMSGVPDKMRRDIDKQKKFEEKYDVLLDLFPKVSHVTQNAAITPYVDLSKILKFLKQGDDVPLPRKLGKVTDCKKQDFKRKPMLPEPLILLEEIVNKRDIIKTWKMHYDRFPTFKCYNQMREKYRFHSAIDSTLDTQEISESFVVTRKSIPKQHAELTNEDEKPPPSAPNGELLFTDKYKPLLIEQVLVNLTPVNLLKEFLSSWSSPGNTGGSSGYTSEESNSSQFNSNSVVLLGPKSSGKSNAVFALANEMNFNVLEINAGMKRSGKKLLTDLHEATQSHQIRKKQKDGVSAKSLLKKTLSNQNSDIMKMSLILIEDADIIFENYDAGFVDAIYTLASSSKRPLIIVAEDPNCPHLQRLIKQNSIVFNPPNPLSISKFLSVLALLENCPIELNQLLSLYLYNRKDLRRTINEMQFFIQSGGDKRVIENCPLKYFAIPPKKKAEFMTEMADDGLYMHKGFFEFYTDSQPYPRIPYPVNFSGLWLNMKEMLPKALTTSPVAKKKRRSKGPAIKPKTSDFSTFSDFYENISVAETIAFVESQRENRAYVYNLGDEISHYLVEASIKINLNVPECPYNLYDDTQRECTSVMRSLQPMINAKPSAQASVDYEPCLRTICRSELTRQEGERKGSRFYHHLRFMSTNFSAVSNEFQKRVCTIFHDNSENDEPVLSQESQPN
ncbi:ATAD5 family protein [Megaselia abdita]